MEYRGRVKNGVIVVDGPQLPEGAVVRVLSDEVALPIENDRLRAFEELQQSMKLTPERAAKWVQDARHERSSFGKIKDSRHL